MEVAIKVIVHPLSLLQIADHHTRSEFFTEYFDFLCGVIYGMNDGTKIEVCSVIEAYLIREDDKIRIDSEAYEGLTKHHSMNYKNETPIGWYIIGKPCNDDIEAINKAFSSKFEVFLRGEFDDNQAESLALYYFEKNEWNPVKYSYESELAERVGLLQLQSEGNAESQVNFSVSAFQSLKSHLNNIIQYLNAVKNGDIPFNADLIRRCNTIAIWWVSPSPIAEIDQYITEAQLSLLCGLIAQEYLKK